MGYGDDRWPTAWQVSRRPRDRRSEIRLVRFRDIVVEQMSVALGADFFDIGLLHAPETPHRGPGLVEGVGIIDAEPHFESLAVVDQLPTLGDMQLFGMRRAVGIDECLGSEPDGVDHERVTAFILADRFAVPRWLRLLRMRCIEVDAANLLIARVQHQHQLRRLNEVVWLGAAKSSKVRDTSHRTARARREGDLAGDHLVVVLLHAFLDPRLEVRVCQIGDSEGRLPYGVVGHVGVLWVEGHRLRPGVAADRKERTAHPDPAGRVRGKIGPRGVVLCRDLGGERHADEAGRDTVREKPGIGECGHRALLFASFLPCKIRSVGLRRLAVLSSVDTRRPDPLIDLDEFTPSPFARHEGKSVASWRRGGRGGHGSWERGPSVWQRMAQLCYARRERLSVRELEFVPSIMSRRGESGDRQQRWLENIYTRVAEPLPNAQQLGSEGWRL